MSCEVLVVDDEKDSGELIKRKLESLDSCNVSLECEVSKAQSKVVKGEVDCVVSDFNMGEMDGLEFFGSISETDTAFILFTGKGSEKIASKAISAGVTDYIRKGGPEQYDRLVNRVSKTLSRRSVEKKLKQQRDILENKNKVLEEFHEVTTLNSDFEYKIDEILRIGLEFFDLDVGILSRIEGYDYHIEAIKGSDVDIEEGEVLNLENTFCQSIVKQKGPVYFNRYNSDEIEDHPAYERQRAEVYVGVPVYVGKELYGSLNFSGFEKVERDLEAEGKNLIRLGGEWIGKELSRLKSRDEAKAKQNRLRQVIDNLPQLVFAKDEEGEFILANEAVAEVYGTTVKELEGSTDSMFAESNEEVENFREADNEVIDSGETQKIDEKLTTAQGEKRIFQTTKIPYNPVNSIGKAVLGVSHDITDSKEREQSLEKILDASREMSKAKNAEEIANVAVKTMEKALKMKLCSMHEHKSSENIFKPLAASDKAKEILGDMTLEEKSSLAGEAFNKKESRIYEDLEQINDVYNPDSVIKSEIIIPVGDYGILISGSRQKRYFGQGEVYLAKLLASITKASLERAERETKIREREKELEMKSSAMKSTMDGIAIADEDGEYIYMNKAHAQMFGRSTEFFMGKSWTSLYGDDEAERIKQEVFPILKEEGQWMGETVGIKQDGTEIIQEITLSFMEDGKLICTNRDITDKKKSKRELEEKNRRLDEFNRIISHDLRNPLNVAMGYLDLSMENMNPSDLEKVENSLKRMKNIIDELLAVSGNSENFVKENLEVRNVLEEAVRFRDEEIDYVVEESIELEASRAGLTNIFDNLISNSLKHNDNQVQVKIGSTDSGFFYEDNGNLEADLTEIKNHGFSTSEHGRGLGISIVERLAEANSWDLELVETSNGSLRVEFNVL